jgi:alanine racemase
VTRLRSTRVEVDLGAVRHNVGVLKPPGSELMAVVKADGYGHGAVEIARAALDAGASRIGVALVEEGLELRAAGIDVPILVLSELPAGAEGPAIDARLTPALYSDEGLDRLAAAARGRPVGVHVKVDTGMHRVGIWPPGDAVGFLTRVNENGLRADGLWTHFACAAEDRDATDRQLSMFLGVVTATDRAGLRPPLLHAANTGGTILYPASHLDMVRTGIGMYGIEPAPGIGEGLGLRPALTWRSTVTAVRRLAAGERVSYGHQYRIERDATVATVPVGYGDGYPRVLSSRADVLVAGCRCGVAGAVTMDQLMIDCGDLPIRPGDDVVLLGSQGDEEVSAQELANLAGTIGYEIVTRIGSRVPREYRS